MFNVDVFENQWKSLSKKVRPHWLALTDEDVKRIEGHVDVLVALLQEKYGYTQPQAEEEVDRFLRETTETEPVGRPAN